MKRHKGFTLVEILIVLTIMGILAMLLFPVFSRVREGGRRTHCAANLRQLGLAFLQYSQDHNGKLPQGKRPPPNGKGNGWAGAIYSYAKDANVFRCPSDRGLDGIQGTVSYAYNQAIPYINVTASTGFTSLRRMRNPARTVLLSEISTLLQFELSNVNEDVSPHACGLTSSSRISADTQYATGYLGGLNGGFSPNLFISPDARHGNSANYLFCDGHVKALPGHKVSPGLAAINSRGPQTGEDLPRAAAGTQNTLFAATFSPI